MNYTNLNPVVHTAALVTRPLGGGEFVGYDSRIIYIFSGDVCATVSGKKLGHLGAGELLYIPAGVPYKLKGQFLEAAVITFDVVLDDTLSHERILPVPVADFEPSICRTPNITPFDTVLHLCEMESEADVFTKMCNLFISAEGAFREKASAMLKLTLLKIAETADEFALPARMVETLDNYIRENYADDISNTEIGAIFGYHPFYVSKVLKDKKGITLKQYIIKYKLKAARAMLENSAKTINEIADETGFTDASYFTKTFKAAFGETPKEFRSKYKDGAV